MLPPCILPPPVVTPGAAAPIAANAYWHNEIWPESRTRSPRERKMMAAMRAEDQTLNCVPTKKGTSAKAAQAMGVGIWATPWTPPAADKSNDSTIEGTLTNPSAWAATLAAYITTMKGQGINLLAVSSQNEPEANVTYESCSYDGATLATFVGTSMGPALKGSGVKLMTPETQNWQGFASFEPALAANSAAWAATSPSE